MKKLIIKNETARKITVNFLIYILVLSSGFISAVLVLLFYNLGLITEEPSTNLMFLYSILYYLGFISIGGFDFLDKLINKKKKKTLDEISEGLSTCVTERIKNIKGREVKIQKLKKARKKLRPIIPLVPIMPIPIKKIDLLGRELIGKDLRKGVEDD